MTPHWATKPLNIYGLADDVDPADVLHDAEELIEELWTRPGTLVMVLHEGRTVIDADGRLGLLTTDQVDEAIGESTGVRLYLGRVRPSEGVPDDGLLVAGDDVHGAELSQERVPVIAVLLTDEEASRLAEGEWLTLRDAHLRLHPLDAGLLTRAVALVNWHHSHSFSPRSGRPMSISRGGWVRVDEADGTEHFPRTDPAVIVAVTDGEDRVLLGSNQAWNERVFSLIAGFVDPGESLEQAVIREVYEEAGVRVRAPKYLGSQPWPFPASLMLGFQATVAVETDALVPDGVEIRALRWFTRNELSEAVADGSVIIPGGASIARSILNAWHGNLPGAE